MSTQISRISCGKSRKTDHAKNDRISNLPDFVLCHILSRLPMKDAVRTSVLSKDWEYKWTSIHNIQLFDGVLFEKSKRANFARFVERTLHQSQNLQIFRLTCFWKYDLRRLKNWISAALGRRVHCLRISYTHGSIVLPSNHPNWYSLRELELLTPCTFKVPTKICFPYLTTLKLQKVEILNENFHSDQVQFNFPVLETLKLIICKWLNVKYVKICSPKMTTFRYVTSWSAEVNDYSIEIVGDNLVKFELDGGLLENIVLSGGSEVTYADLAFDSGRYNLRLLEKTGLRIRELLNGTSSLKDLKLSDLVIKAIALSRLGVPLPKYYKMERLVLSYYFRGNTEALLELLHTVPFLKILDIQAKGWNEHDYDGEEYVPSCIVSHLEIVNFTCTSARMHELLKLVKFFLKNAVELKKVSFSVLNGPSPPILKNKITEELSTYPRASNSLTIVFT